MKRIILFVLLAAVGCSKTPLNRAKENVRQYIKTMLNDPSSYKSVVWGTLDSVSKDYSTIYKFKDIEAEIFLVEKEIPEGKKRGMSAKQVVQDFIKTNNLKEGIDYIIDARQIYPGDINIFMIDHSFRVRDKKKEKALVKYRFYLDSALMVTKAEEQDIKAIDSDRNK